MIIEIVISISFQRGFNKSDARIRTINFWNFKLGQHKRRDTHIEKYWSHKMENSARIIGTSDVEKIIRWWDLLKEKKFGYQIDWLMKTICTENMENKGTDR